MIILTKGLTGPRLMVHFTLMVYIITDGPFPFTIDLKMNQFVILYAKLQKEMAIVITSK